MEAEIPVYKIKIDQSDLSATGVQAISNVKFPAIESNFVALSALKELDDQDVLTVNKERFTKLADFNGKEMKGLLTGPILIPDFQILRMDENRNPYFITFSAEVIEQIRDKFSKGGWHRNTTDEHEAPLGGNTIVELWIVEDPEKDKSAALGLTVPKGTLMATMKVEDHEYFQREILSGNRRGFSIEGWFAYDGPFAVEAKQVQAAKTPIKPTQNRSQNRKLNMSTIKKKGLFAHAVAVLFGALKADGKEDQEMHVLEDGTEIVVVDETQQPFYLTEGNLGDALEDGEYLLNDGRTLVVMEGKASEIRDAEVVEDPAAEPADDVVVVEESADILATAMSVQPTVLKAALAAAKLGLTKLSGNRSLKVKMKADGLTKLAILVDSENKAIYVDPTTGYAWYVNDSLWVDEHVPAGEYLLQDGTTLVVFEKSETYTDWDGAEVTVTHSMVNYTSSTVPVETLVPWLKETMSAVVQAGEELAKAKAENAILKAANAKLKSEPAAPAKAAPLITTPARVSASKSPKVEARNNRAAAALAALDRINPKS